MSVVPLLVHGKVFLSDGWHESVEQDPGNYFASDGGNGDSPVIGALILFTLVILPSYDDGIAKSLWQLALLSATDKKIVKLVTTCPAISNRQEDREACDNLPCYQQQTRRS